MKMKMMKKVKGILEGEAGIEIAVTVAGGIGGGLEEDWRTGGKIPPISLIILFSRNHHKYVEKKG